VELSVWRFLSFLPYNVIKAEKKRVFALASYFADFYLAGFIWRRRRAENGTSEQGVPLFFNIKICIFN
jgi:hypothetical protein